MKALFLATIFLVGLGCSSKQPSLKGHWHVSPIETTEISGLAQSFTVDVLNDTLAILNKDVRASNWAGYLDQKEQVFHFSEECFSGRLRYTFEAGNLMLHREAYDGSNTERFIGIFCSRACCDKQKEYFMESHLAIDLPVALDTSGLINISPRSDSLHIPLFFGRSKQVLQDNPETNYQFELDGQLTSIEGIERYEELTLLSFPAAYRKRLIHVVYGDANTPLEQIFLVLKKYQELEKDKRIYVALRAGGTSTFQLRYRKLAFAELELVETNQELTLADWLSDITTD